MAFVEARLLDCVSYGTQGGPTFLTRRVGLRSGIIRRNPLRSRPLYEFIIVYRNLQAEDHQAVIDAFNACFAGVYSFRLKDWSDFEATDELIGTASGAAQTVQLAKLYSFGTRTISRPIRKPVTGTVVITANSVPISASVDYTTGEATFTATAGHVLRWSGEFDVPVFFQEDKLIFSFDTKNADGLFLTSDVTLMEDIAA